MAINSIGVDVDSKYLVCRIQRGEKRYPIAQFDNNPPGFRRFIKWATKRHQQARVTIEATGVYSQPFALALHATKDIEVSVMTPNIPPQP